MVKKYEFDNQAQAYKELQAKPNGTMFLKIEGAENAVDLGHWPIKPAKFDAELKEVEPAVLSVKYLVDVDWLNPKQEVIERLSKYEVFPKNPKHSFPKELPHG